jgi:acyl dehydratase
MTRVEGAEGLCSLVGQEVGVSEWHEVSQAAVAAFAEVTGDRQWIHLDRERTRAESPYGTTVAHGFLTLALLSRLHGEAVAVTGFARVINYGLNRVRFPAPVPTGARVRARSKLLAVEKISGGVQATWAVTVEVEGGQKPALAAEWLLRYYS